MTNVGKLPIYVFTRQLLAKIDLILVTVYQKHGDDVDNFYKKEQ